VEQKTTKRILRNVQSHSRRNVPRGGGSGTAGSSCSNHFPRDCLASTAPAALLPPQPNNQLIQFRKTILSIHSLIILVAAMGALLTGADTDLKLGGTKSGTYRKAPERKF